MKTKPNKIGERRTQEEPRNENELSDGRKKKKGRRNDENQGVVERF